MRVESRQLLDRLTTAALASPEPEVHAAAQKVVQARHKAYAWLDSAREQLDGEMESLRDYMVLGRGRYVLYTFLDDVFDFRTAYEQRCDEIGLATIELIQLIGDGRDL